MSSPETIDISELDPEIIPPLTKNIDDPEYNGGSKIVVVGKPGCFTPGTKVMMFDGSFRNVEDVKVGEQVMGDDSTARNVLELCYNSDEMFKIVPKSGEPYTVNKQHKLVLHSSGYANQHKFGDILEITVENFLKKSKTWQESWCIFKTGVDFSEQEVELNPYIFGVWLGDGTISKSEITTADFEIVQSINDCCEENDMIFRDYTKESERCSNGGNKFLNFLRENDLYKNKHIPQHYKCNSRDIRLELLAGILDTDGSYDIDENVYDFIQKSERLTDDVVFLARSLGFRAIKRACIKSCIYKGEKITSSYFRLTISGDICEIPCRILRKWMKPRKQSYSVLVSCFHIEPQGEGEYYGFTLDGNHRFLLGTFDVVRNTGKSSLIKGLLYAKKHIFPVGIAMSGSEDTNHAFAEILPSTFVFNEYDEEKIKDVIKRQKLARQHLQNPWLVMVVDDCTDDPRIFNKPLQNALYKKGRHWKLMYILSLQYAMDIKPQIRTNIDGIFILREPIESNREKLYRNYASIIPSYDLFCDIMDQLTEDYHALYIHNATRSNRWQDCVFYWRAKLPPKGWKIGCPEFWDFHNQRYNPEYTEPLLGF